MGTLLFFPAKNRSVPIFPSTREGGIRRDQAGNVLTCRPLQGINWWKIASRRRSEGWRREFTGGPMKKLIIYSLAIILVFSFAVSCKKKPKEVPPAPPQTQEQPPVERVEQPKIQELSLIHISEPTRRTPISYAVFC